MQQKFPRHFPDISMLLTKFLPGIPRSEQKAGPVRFDRSRASPCVRSFRGDADAAQSRNFSFSSTLKLFATSRRLSSVMVCRIFPCEADIIRI